VIYVPKLTREDWRNLRDQYGAAFTGLSDLMFTTLLDQVYGPVKEGNPGTNPGSTGELDEVDAMMVCLARSEPGIQPQPPDAATASSEPGIQPAPPPIE
jgi:hypothetical protein